MSISNRRIIIEVGEFLRASRMAKNIPQRVLAERSGVSISSVKHLESGVGATLATFIAVCRTLGKLGWIQDLAPRGEISPIAVMDRKTSEKPRQRARMPRTSKEPLHV